MLRFLVFVGLSFISISQIWSQCVPSVADQCQEAATFCSLSAMNGYSCSNESGLSTGCSGTLCDGSSSDNTVYWSFVSEGGIVYFTLHVGSCTGTNGLQYEIS
ncbi:MAG: hypothetical protein IPM34_10100 [Saprospiraceae bacterium]|nr:hypothetical protein [Saprospiraceae bacterium]